MRNLRPPGEEARLYPLEIMVKVHYECKAPGEVMGLTHICTKKAGTYVVERNGLDHVKKLTKRGEDTTH